MAKANNKDVYYFSHDCNARNDPNMKSLRAVYGLEGYAVYFMLIEILREQPGFKYPMTKYAYKNLAEEIRIGQDLLEQIINDCCIEFKDAKSSLLSKNTKYLWSDSLIRRMGAVEDISIKRKKAAEKRWEKRDNINDSNDFESDANALQNENDANANNDGCNAQKMQNGTLKRKGKERKGKKIKGEERKEEDLKPYGTLTNVFLLESENQNIIDTYENSKKLIDKISTYLANATRTYDNHYALIIKIAEEDNWPKKKKITVGEEVPTSNVKKEPMPENMRAALNGEGIFKSLDDKGE